MVVNHVVPVVDNTCTRLQTKRKNGETLAYIMDFAEICDENLFR